MSNRIPDPVAPRWQRILAAIFVLGAGLSLVTQVTGNPGISEFTFLQWIRFTGALLGTWLFLHIAVRGSLPRFLLKSRKPVEDLK